MMNDNNKLVAYLAACQPHISGSICFTSRKKEGMNNTILEPKDGIGFGTLHCLADKVLNVRRRPHYLDSMWRLVEQSLELVTQLSTTPEIKQGQILEAYRFIRKMENGDFLAEYEFEEIFEIYEALKEKKGGYDWEDSIVVATFYLEEEGHYRLPYDNLVLINLESLLQSENTNILRFYTTLCTHLSTQGTKCYMIDKDMQIYQYSANEALFRPLTSNTFPIAFQVS